MQNDDAAITVRIMGRLAKELQETAQELGWPLEDLVGHLAAKWTEEAHEGWLIDDEDREYPPRDPAAEGTHVQVTTAPAPADPDTLAAELASDERASILADLAEDDDPKLAWERKVRDHLRAMGYDPDEVEANAGGFGMDFAEWGHDPEGYATDVAEEAYGDKW